MLDKNGNRMLAYVTEVLDIQPIPNYDRVELATVLGWKVIISKSDNIKIGDKVVYFEIDSKLPKQDERFSFLEKRHYKVKTIKMCGTISQGLVMPLTLFPELANAELNTDATKILKVKYSVEEDNKRKSNNPNAKYESMVARKKKLFKKPWAKWLMKRAWGRKLMFLFFGRKKDNPKGFPSFISKTDEERVENQPWRIGDNKPYIATEKLDGTSATYVLERKRFGKYEYYVCSRNVRQKDINQACYHDTNVYWEMALKYNIENHLKNWLTSHPEDKWVCIQGEIVGNVQGNPLKLNDDDLYVFNFVTSSSGRYSSYSGKDIVSAWGIKWVPIIGEVFMPDTMEQLKLLADGPSTVNPDVLREGYVYRSLDGKDSFKNVSRKFLLEKGL
jgi:hypothetical protein